MSISRTAGIIGAVLIIGAVAAAVPGWADVEQVAQSPKINGSLSKLGRGIANIFTCPFELIRTPVRVEQRDGMVAGMSVGVLQGAWRTILRCATGVFEVVTFPLEIPKGYEPLMKPEFVWVSGDWAE